MSVIEIKNLKKSFEKDLLILKDISLSIEEGESVAIIGKSGTGKSTLLHLVGLLDKPDSGLISINGNSVASLNDKQLSKIRNTQIGFVFQSHMLMEDFTLLENIMVPSLIAGNTRNEAKQKALDLISLIGLQDRKDHYPNQLSGGEKQRTAICRALMNNPAIILADEPTGSLDEENAKLCEDVFFDLVKKNRTALLLVTHNIDFAMRCERVYEIKNHVLSRVK